MKCKFCGKEIEDGSVFCGYCGKKQPQVKICVKCGHEIGLDDKWCGYCGASQEKNQLEKQEKTDAVSNEDPHNSGLYNLHDNVHENTRKMQTGKDSCQTNESKERSNLKYKMYFIGCVLLLLIFLGGLGYFVSHGSQIAPVDNDSTEVITADSVVADTVAEAQQTEDMADKQNHFFGDGRIIEVRGHVKKVEENEGIITEFTPDGKMKDGTITRNSDGQITECIDGIDQRKYTYDSKGRVATFSEGECTIYNKGYGCPNIVYTYHYDDNDDVVSADVDVDYPKGDIGYLTEVTTPKHFRTKFKYSITSTDSHGNWTTRKITGQYVSLEPDGDEEGGMYTESGCEATLYYKHVNVNITQKRKIFYY